MALAGALGCTRGCALGCSPKGVPRAGRARDDALRATWQYCRYCLGSIATGSRSGHRPALSYSAGGSRLSFSRATPRRAIRSRRQSWRGRRKPRDASGSAFREKLAPSPREFGNACAISADERGDVVRVPPSEKSRELGAELLLERDRATRKRSRGAARVEPVGRTPAHRASCGQSLARAGCQSASRWQYCPGSIGSIARSRGDTLPRQARATIPYPPVRTRETYDRSNTRNASSTLPNGADTCTPCTASLTRSNISCAIAIPSATACSFDFSFA